MICRKHNNHYKYRNTLIFYVGSIDIVDILI